MVIVGAVSGGAGGDSLGRGRVARGGACRSWAWAWRGGGACRKASSTNAPPSTVPKSAGLSEK
eukprot:842092-Prymnesium_polylepis.1